MHVGLIVPVYSGVEGRRIPALETLVRALVPHVELTVFPLRNPCGPPRMKLDGATVIDGGKPGLRLRHLGANLLRALYAEHRRRPFDLLHGYWVFEPGLLAVAAGRALGVPVVVSIGGAEPVALSGIGYGGQLERRGRLTFRSVTRRAALVTGGSTYVLELARQAGAPPDRLRLAPLPVEPAICGAKGRHASGDTLLLQVGAYLPVKGQDVAIRALPRILDAHPGARLVMLGENPRGYRERMAELACGLGVGGAVELRERIPHAELAGWYRAASLLLMPSRHESQGMVVLEAAAHGLPALGSDLGVIGDLAPEAAVAVPPGDVESMADEAITLLGEPGRRLALGEAARERVAARYAPIPAGRAWLEAYREALEARGH